MGRLRDFYMRYCSPKFIERKGFGDHGYKKLLNVVAVRLTKQHVLGCKPTEVDTVEVSEEDHKFLTFLKDYWWPLYQVLARRPFNSMGLVKHMRGEFFREHVSQLHTYQTMVHRPPPHGLYDYLTPGRLYTIYKKNFAWQYQPYYENTGANALAMSERNHNDLASEGGRSPLPDAQCDSNLGLALVHDSVLPDFQKKKDRPCSPSEEYQDSYQLVMKHRRVQTLVESFY